MKRQREEDEEVLERQESDVQIQDVPHGFLVERSPRKEEGPQWRGFEQTWPKGST